MANLLVVSVEQVKACIAAGRRLEKGGVFTKDNDIAKAKRALIAVSLAATGKLDEANLRKLYGRKTATGEWILAGGKTTANVLQSFDRDAEATFPMLGWPDDVAIPASVGGRGRRVTVNPDLEFDMGSLETMLADREKEENPPQAETIADATDGILQVTPEVAEVLNATIGVMDAHKSQVESEPAPAPAKRNGRKNGN